MDQAKTGAFITQLRKEAGWTQAQLGDRVGVTNKTVSRWENGNYMPDLDTCLQLSELFGIPVNTQRQRPLAEVPVHLPDGFLQHRAADALAAKVPIHYKAHDPVKGYAPHFDGIGVPRQGLPIMIRPTYLSPMRARKVWPMS